jgi:hypothetical protein
MEGKVTKLSQRSSWKRLQDLVALDEDHKPENDRAGAIIYSWSIRQSRHFPPLILNHNSHASVLLTPSHPAAFEANLLVLRAACSWDFDYYGQHRSFGSLARSAKNSLNLWTFGFQQA